MVNEWGPGSILGAAPAGTHSSPGKPTRGPSRPHPPGGNETQQLLRVPGASHSKQDGETHPGFTIRSLPSTPKSWDPKVPQDTAGPRVQACRAHGWPTAHQLFLPPKRLVQHLGDPRSRTQGGRNGKQRWGRTALHSNPALPVGAEGPRASPSTSPGLSFLICEPGVVT